MSERGERARAPARPRDVRGLDGSDRGRRGARPRRRARKGVERNLVLTMWDWGGPATFAHDELTTDKRNPDRQRDTVRSTASTGATTASSRSIRSSTRRQEMRIPVLDPKVPPGKPQSMPVPSPYWGNELYWFDPAITNHAAMDSKGRVWMSSRFRLPENQPAFCADHPSAALAPQASELPADAVLRSEDAAVQAGRHLLRHAPRAVRDDADETLYGNGVFSGAIGWVNTRVLDETGDDGAAQGWCRRYRSTSTQDGEDRSRTSDRAARRLRSVTSTASSRIRPTAASGARCPGPMPGKIVRIDPKTCVARSVRAAVQNPAVERQRLHAARHRRRFERRDLDGARGQRPPGELRPAQVQGRCRARRRPTASTAAKAGRCIQCRARASRACAATSRSTSTTTTSSIASTRSASAPNIPLANGTNSDSLLALQPDGSWVVLRVPYPLGFFSRGMDGRIDDPNGGWKGRALYADYGPNAVWHIEGGLGTRSAVVKFQLRPDPLAK